MIDPVELNYGLRLLPVGRFSFRRWRWELWHGPRLLAAGWRLSPLHAQGALRSHALRYAHRLHGLHPLRTEGGHGREDHWGEGRVVLDWGELRVILTPRAWLAGGEIAA